jgi:tetratricopeptide (TPR) repeat protein
VLEQRGRRQGTRERGNKGTSEPGTNLVRGELRVRYSRRMRRSDFLPWVRLLVVLGGGLAMNAGVPCGAQSGHNMAEMETIPPPEQLPVPVKMDGIGNSHISIKASPEAQAWFDQGLSLQHDFWDYEAQKAFEQAIRVDPNCAMCWWGLAQAEGFRNSDTKAYGKKALAEAVRLKGKASASDKLYIEAAVAEQNAKEDDGKAAVPFYRKLVKKFPHDPQARIFLAESLCDGYDDAGEPKAGQKECIAILEGVLKEAPNDSAANHYWIHAIEPGAHPERALTSAALLASLAPTSGHMVHMPGHIYYRVGNYAEAERWFAASTNADEKYMRAQHVGPDDDWNYAHNMMYAIANLMEQGRLNDANGLSDRLAGARGKLSNSLYIWSARDQISRLSHRLPVALRMGDWDAVLTMLGQTNLEGEKTANLRALTAELTDYATGMKALDNGDASAAEAASERMDAGLWRIQQRQKEEAAAKAKARQEEKNKPDAKNDEPPKMPVMPDALSEPLMKGLSIQSLELRAGVLATKGKLDEAKKMYAQAKLEEKKLGYHEPPAYIRPVGETEAAALVKAKDYEGAKAALEAALKERPGSGFGLYGLARVKELSGDAAGAREGYGAFLKAWEKADAGLPEVAHARKIVAGESMAEN